MPANTIRTWERRYGFPVAERTGGGHREYPASAVPHLGLVQEALSRGHRPRQVLRLTLAGLRGLLGVATIPDQRIEPDGPLLDHLLEATLNLDATALERGFAAAFSRFGAVAFLEGYAQPFLVAVGEAWESGRMKVYHEHFASERLASFLAVRWQASAGAHNRRAIVLSTLPGEDHALGLHMVATVLAQVGWNPLFLGADTPIQDIVDCAVQSSSQHVGVSVSVHAHSADTIRILEELVAGLPPGVTLLVGGAGAPDVAGAVTMRSLASLEDWADGR